MKAQISVALVSLLTFSATTQAFKSVGDVYEVSSGNLIYREHHTFENANADGTVRTKYKSIDGELIAQRHVQFEDGYASEYTFEQQPAGIFERVHRQANRFEYQYQTGGESKTAQINIDDIDTVVVNAGMFNAVERHWSSLMKGDKVSIRLLVPKRGKAYTMRLKKTDARNKKISEHLELEGTAVFSLSIASTFLGLLVDPVLLGYDVNSKQLVYYEGPSNIQRENGKKWGDIRIIYREPS